MSSTTSRPVEADAAHAPLGPIDGEADTRTSTGEIEVRPDRSRWFWPVALAGGLALFLLHLAQVAQLPVPII